MAPRMEATGVRTARATLGLSASEAAALVGLSEGAAWRQWERNGVGGPGAVLLQALLDSAAVRRHFGLAGTKTRREGHLAPG